MQEALCVHVHTLQASHKLQHVHNLKANIDLHKVYYLSLPDTTAQDLPGLHSLYSYTASDQRLEVSENSVLC